MKQDQMEKAVAITRYKNSLNEELFKWNKDTGDGISHPLKFRLGGDMEYMSKEAFEQFKSANISWLKAKISELDSDFANL